MLTEMPQSAAAYGKIEVAGEGPGPLPPTGRAPPPRPLTWMKAGHADLREVRWAIRGLANGA
jgi:hypothetical protein